MKVTVQGRHVERVVSLPMLSNETVRRHTVSYLRGYARGITGASYRSATRVRFMLTVGPRGPLALIRVEVRR